VGGEAFPLKEMQIKLIGASLSEPHCSIVNDEISVYIYICLYGGQLSVYYSLMSNYSNKLRKFKCICVIAQ